MTTTKKPAQKTATTRSSSSAKAKATKKPSGKKTQPGNTDEKLVTIDRRKTNHPVATERRKKVNRRRQIDPTTCERDYTPDEIEFMSALDEYKRANGRMFPTCSEVLEVIKDLGYAKQSVVMSPDFQASQQPTMGSSVPFLGETAPEFFEPAIV